MHVYKRNQCDYNTDYRQGRPEVLRGVKIIFYSAVLKIFADQYFGDHRCLNKKTTKEKEKRHRNVNELQTILFFCWSLAPDNFA